MLIFQITKKHLLSWICVAGFSAWFGWAVTEWLLPDSPIPEVHYGPGQRVRNVKE